MYAENEEGGLPDGASVRTINTVYMKGGYRQKKSQQTTNASLDFS
jgi:hypothetical protein